MSKFAIKSKNIYIDDTSPVISGYLLIDSELISNVISLDEVSSDILVGYKILDYEDYYVMPGATDLNAHLNENFEEDWKDIENTTKQALMGGVTTIIDNPIMNHHNHQDFDEISNIKARESNLNGKISTDCALLAYLGPHNYKDYEDIFRKTGVLGFKLYFSQPFEANLPIFEMEDLRNFLVLFEQTCKSCTDLIISINCEMASTRDLFMASPCRKTDIETRLDLNFDIYNFSGFGGGHHGVFLENDTEEERNSRRKSRSLTEKPVDNIFDLISDIKTLEANANNRDNISPSTAMLNLNSQLVSNILEQKHISDLELLEYENSSATLHEKNIAAHNFFFDFLDHDSNLEEDSLNLIDNIEEKYDNNEDFEKKNEFKGSYYNLQTPKRFESCPFISDTFQIKQTFEEAFEEIKKTDKSEDLNNSDRSINSNSSFQRASNSSFGHRRKTLIEKKSQTPMNSKFKDLACIKTKKTIHQEKENRKNRNYNYFLPNHPVSWETNGINTILKLCKDAISPNYRLILTNLSSSCLAFKIREAKKQNPYLQIFCDTASPFLFFNRNMINESETKFKSSPPIRDKENQYLLVRSAKALIFDSVSSYHLSVPEKLKSIDSGNFRRAFNGISSIGGTLFMLWTKFYSILKISYKKKGENVNKEEMNSDIERIIKKLIFLTSTSPARLAFLDKSKGSLKKGKLADIVIWDPFKIKKIKQKEEILLKTPKLYCLDGYKVYGEVLVTILRGEIVFRREKDDTLFFNEGKGKIIHNKMF